MSSKRGTYQKSTVFFRGIWLTYIGKYTIIEVCELNMGVRTWSKE